MRKFRILGFKNPLVGFAEQRDYKRARGYRIREAAQRRESERKDAETQRTSNLERDRRSPVIADAGL